MSRFAFVVGCLVAVAVPASAAPVVGQVQPDSLPFGTLHTGAVAEGSFMIFAPADDPKPKIKVDAPKFVTVLNTGTHAQQFGPGNDFTCVSVEVAIDAAKAGDLKGEIKVTVGEVVTKVPVSATVKERKAGTPRVLIVGTPFERYSTSDGKEYTGWTNVVDAAGLDVSYLLLRKDTAALRDIDLSKFDCVLLSADALVSQTAADIKRVRAFVEAGGRLVVTANAFFIGSVKGANAVLDGYGIEMKDVEAPKAQEVELTKDNFDADVVKAAVGKAKFFRASPVKVDKGGRVLVSTPEFDEPGYGYVATAKAGKGEVVALGESLWWNWVSEGKGKGQANGSDNGKLLAFLLAPPRKS
jgi:hypothetical protein